MGEPRKADIDNHAPSTPTRLLRRLLVTFGVLLVFLIGRRVPIPGLDSDVVRGLIGAGRLSGERFSIFTLGVMPVFSALIIFEIIKLVVPALDRWETSDIRHVTRLRRYVMAAALLFATFQAQALSGAFEGISGLIEEPRWTFHAVVIATLVGATALLGWLADSVTLHGVGDGFWLLLLTPYALKLPDDVLAGFELWRRDADAPTLLLTFAYLVLVIALIVAAYRAQSKAIVGSPLPSEAAATESRVSGAHFTIAWPPLLATYVGGILLLVARLGFLRSAEAAESSALTLGGPLHLAIVALLIMAIAFRQRRSAPGGLAPTSVIDEEPSARGALPPGLVVAVAQLIVTLGGALLTRHLDPPFAIHGAWLFVAGVAAMDILSSLGLDFWSPRRAPTAC